jgi:hypothetical protein
MKRILYIIIFLLVATQAHSAPFVVCDAAPGVTHYTLTGPAWMPASVPAQPDGSLKVDIAQSTPGSTSMTAKACITDPIWGVACSDAAPFAYTRPAPPVTIKAIRLTP